MPANKVRRRGPFAPLSAHYYKDDAVMRAGEKAEVLFTRGLAFQSEVIRDGLITDAQLELLGVGLQNVKGRARKLCEVGLWREIKGVGYQITAWLEWNQSREDIMQAAQKDARRKTPRDAPPPDPGPGGPPSDSERNPARNPNGNGDGFRAESDRLAGAAARDPARAPSTSTSTSRSQAAARSRASVQTASADSATGRRAATLVDCSTPAGVRLADRDRGQLAHVAATALADGVSTTAVVEGLEAWMGRDDCTPALLPSLIGDAVKRHHGATRPGGRAGGPSKFDQWSAIAEALEAEDRGGSVVAFPGTGS